MKGMLELFDKNLRAAIIKMLQTITNMLKINEIEHIKMNQMEILESKHKINKKSVDESNSKQLVTGNNQRT